jgi:hypothetical protein
MNAGRPLAAAALLGVLALVAAAADEIPGPRGLLWGRLAVEEESPEGPWTPLAGVEVTLYPYAPALAADLEAIRQGTRNSAVAHEAAVGRLRTRLETYASELPAGVVRRRTTDPAGLFVFEDLPAGEWLVVAVHVTPYTAARREGRAPRTPKAGRDSTFLPQPARPAKDAEVWVVRVRVGPGERARVALTDRGRFMAGPVR